jgi:hypothetical protein
MFRYPAHPHAPLFTRPFKQPFTTPFVVLMMHQLLLNAGISTFGYSGHSLRKGTAAPLPSLQIATASLNTTSSSWGVGRVTPWTYILTNVKNLIICKRSSVSTHNSSLLFTNLSGIADGHTNSPRTLVFISRNRHLACRDSQRDIAHSKSCGDSPRLSLHMITSAPPLPAFAH